MPEPKELVPRRGGVPMYDPREAERIMEEIGCSWPEAVQIAAAEMGGANEKEGRLFATQTACHELNYRE